MVPGTKPVLVFDSQKSTTEKVTAKKFLRITKETIAILFWIYVIFKLFIFDIDIFLMNQFFPNYVQLLDYKFIILSGIIALVWLVTKNKDILLWALYILVYPATVIFWKVPFFIFKQRSWILAFALINSIIAFFKSIKYTFISASMFLISATLILSVSNTFLLSAAASTILIILLVTYFHRFILIFKPSSVFQVHTKILSTIRNRGITNFSLDDSIKNVPIENLGERQIEKWTQNLQMSVLFNRVCLFTSKKLRDYQNSKLNFFYYVLTVLMLIILTASSFCFINYALYKIDPSLYKLSGVPSVFIFFYYSFNTILFNQIPEISPISTLSQAVSIINAFLALFLIAIFVSLMWSVKSEKYTEELNQVISGIEEQGIAMERFIQTEYKINSIEDAILELEKMKAVFIKFIFKISESIK